MPRATMLVREEQYQPGDSSGKGQQRSEAFSGSAGKPVHLERLLLWDKLSLP